MNIQTSVPSGREPRIGVDIGRVIINGDGADTTFSRGNFFGHDLDEVMRTPAVGGAFAAIAVLVERFEGRVWLVSKCGPKIQERSLAWLDHHEFWTRTGVDRTNVRFCRERPEKAVHARRLALTHFVDDRLDVLGHLVGLVDRLYLFGPQRRRGRVDLPGLIEAPGWASVIADLD